MGLKSLDAYVVLTSGCSDYIQIEAQYGNETYPVVIVLDQEEAVDLIDKLKNALKILDKEAAR